MRNLAYAFLCVLMIALCTQPTSAAMSYDDEQTLCEMIETANAALQDDEDDPYAKIWLNDSRAELVMCSGFEPSEIPDLDDEETYLLYKEFLLSVWLESDFFEEMLRLTAMTERDLRFILVDKSTEKVAASVLITNDELLEALIEAYGGQ